MIQISILGCGWLGLPLAKALLEKGFSVKGSTTSVQKLPLLKNIGVAPFLITLHAGAISGDLVSFLENAQILIIDIPPQLRGVEKENFVTKINTLLPFIERSSIKKVLFVSSTSVYSDDNTTVTEITPAQPVSENGIQLLQAEQLLQQNKAFLTTVVRFGGLIGADRHPIKSLAGRKNIENPNGFINLIHQKDCIGILLKIIEKEMWNETFNAVTPFHPTRKEYYTQKAIDYDLPLPEFETMHSNIGKKISSEKVVQRLAYEFKVPYL